MANAEPNVCMHILPGIPVLLSLFLLPFDAVVSEEHQSAISSMIPKLTQGTTNLWPAQISVCWENSNVNTVDAQSWIRDAMGTGDILLVLRMRSMISVAELIGLSRRFKEL